MQQDLAAAKSCIQQNIHKEISAITNQFAKIEIEEHLLRIGSIQMAQILINVLNNLDKTEIMRNIKTDVRYINWSGFEMLVLSIRNLLILAHGSFAEIKYICKLQNNSAEELTTFSHISMREALNRQATLIITNGCIRNFSDISMIQYEITPLIQEIISNINHLFKFKADIKKLVFTIRILDCLLLGTKEDLQHAFNEHYGHFKNKMINLEKIVNLNSILLEAHSIIVENHAENDVNHIIEMLQNNQSRLFEEIISSFICGARTGLRNYQISTRQINELRSQQYDKELLREAYYLLPNQHAINSLN